MTEHGAPGHTCPFCARLDSRKALADLLLLAYIDGLEQRCPAPRLDTTGRAPLVPLWPAGGDRA